MAIDLSGLVHKKTKLKIGTKEFIFTELTLADMAEFRAYIRAERRTANEQRRERLMVDAAKIGNIEAVELLKMTDSSISEEEFERQAETVEGIGFLAFLSLRHDQNQIAISREQAQKIVTLAVLDQVTEAMFPSSEADVKKKSKSKKSKKKQSQKSPQ